MATLEELRAEAAERGIEGRSSMNKAELEEALSDAQAGDAAPASGGAENANPDDPQPGTLSDQTDEQIADAQAAGGTGVTTTPTDRGVLRPEDQTSDANRRTDELEDSPGPGDAPDVDTPVTDAGTREFPAGKRPSTDDAVRLDALSNPPANEAELQGLKEAWRENPNDSNAPTGIGGGVAIDPSLRESMEGEDLTPDPEQRARVVPLTDGSVVVQIGSVAAGEDSAGEFEAAQTIVLHADAASDFLEEAGEAAQVARTARASAIANRRTIQTVLG